MQVQPEKQLKMMYAVAFELSELSEKCEGEMSHHYLRLSTLATVAVQEKFGQSQKVRSSQSSIFIAFIGIVFWMYYHVDRFLFLLLSFRKIASRILCNTINETCNAFQ